MAGHLPVAGCDGRGCFPGDTWLAAGRSRKASLVGVSRVTGGTQGWRGVVDHPHCLRCPKGEAGLELEPRAFPEHSPPYIKSRY